MFKSFENKQIENVSEISKSIEIQRNVSSKIVSFCSRRFILNCLFTSNHFYSTTGWRSLSFSWRSPSVWTPSMSTVSFMWRAWKLLDRSKVLISVKRKIRRLPATAALIMFLELTRPIKKTKIQSWLVSRVLKPKDFRKISTNFSRTLKESSPSRWAWKVLLRMIWKIFRSWNIWTWDSIAWTLCRVISSTTTPTWSG